jgi:hypothetical protein
MWFVLSAAVVSVALAAPASAMSAADFLDRFNDDQRAAYVDGAIETLAYTFAAAGDQKRASCVLDWYYRGPGPQQLGSTLKDHRDLPVGGVLQALTRRLCTG